jgi:ABC-type Mn2+/Zn2+ transport system ATPase subunit
MLINVELLYNKGNIELTLNDDVTFITGSNGSGKTLLIESILNQYNYNSYLTYCYLKHNDTTIERAISNLLGLFNYNNEDLTEYINRFEIVASGLLEMNVELINYSLIIKSHQNELIRLDKLSKGQKQLLLILLRAIPLFGYYNDNYILIYDAPENDLHVTWRKELVEAIKTIYPYKNLRLLIATHDPSIINHNWDNAINMNDLINK